MMEMIKEREENREHFMLTLTLGGVSLVSFITLLIVVCVYTDIIPLPVKIVLICIACIVFAVGMFAVMEGQRKIGYYRCAECGKTFKPSLTAHMFGVNICSKRRMTCPVCGKRSWCKKVMSGAQN